MNHKIEDMSEQEISEIITSVLDLALKNAESQVYLFNMATATVLQNELIIRKLRDLSRSSP